LRDEANQQVENALDSTTLIIISASILLMLALILTAMVSKQMARKKTKKTMQEELYISNQLDDEEQRRLEWIDFYVKEGNLDKARELGWTGDEVVPQWKQYEMDQEAVQEAAIPGMLSLDDL
jgi:flagellar biosynthesis/type III secretory pathway M-ring protein FliF/YscJ